MSLFKPAVKEQKNDYLNDPIHKIYLKLGIPILISSVVSVFASLITNKVFSSCFPEYFPVSAILSVLISIVSNISASIVSAGWTKFSASFASKDNRAGKNLVTLSVSLLVVQVTAEGLLIAFTNPLLHWLNTPAEIYDFTRTYLIVYLIASIFTAASSMFVTLATGLESARGVLIINICNCAFPTVAVALLVGVFRLGIIGSALYTGVAALMVSVLTIVIMSRNRSLVKPRKEDFKIDIRSCFSVLYTALLIYLQTLLCSVGYLLVSAQTNRYLSLNYISILGVSIPISAGLSVFSTVISVVIPQNYLKGQYARTKKILWTTFFSCEAYGVFCFLFYVIVGRPYYASLFSDPNLISLGVEYWILYGIGFAAVPAVYVIRFFFVAVQRPGLALFSGVFELIGNLICAYILIPWIGNAGRSLSYPLGWLLATIYLFAAYFIFRKRIYKDHTEKPKEIKT